MGRLTNNIDYCDTNCDFGKRGECFFKDKSKCYEKSMHDKLKAYEDIIDDPDKLKLIDELYLERCEEINRLKAELAEKEENFCEWQVWDEEVNAYHTSCENAHFIVDGSPKDNDYAYCPYCGRKIKEVQVC